MNSQIEHDIKSSLRFLENLHEELTICNDIKELQDEAILKKFKETIVFLEKILST